MREIPRHWRPLSIRDTASDDAIIVNENSYHHPLCRQTVTGFRPEDRHGNPVQVSNIQPPEINIEGIPPPTTRESSDYADTT